MRKLLALALLAGCSPVEFAFTPSVKSISSKADNCAIEAMTSPPERGFVEVGTLQLYNGDAPKTLEAFKKAVHKTACEEGGDVVIGIATDKGEFTTGTVLKYTDTGANPVKAGAPPAQQTDNELPK
jgi:hypothetical protein